MLSDDDITQAYRAIFRTDPTDAQVNFFASNFDTLDDAIDSMISAVDDTTVRVLRFFQTYFDRVAEDEGLDFWTNFVDENPENLSNAEIETRLAREFFDSGEFASLNDVDDARLTLTSVYQNVLGREPDTAGLNFWVNFFEDTVEALVAGGATQEEAENEALFLTSQFFATAPETIETYAPLSDNFLTQLATLDEGEDIDREQSLFAFADGDGGTGSGNIINLTTAVEELSGTADVDTFVGVVGGDTTLNAGDVLRGLGGDDTLRVTVTEEANFNLALVDLFSVENADVRIVGGAGEINFAGVEFETALVNFRNDEIGTAPAPGDDEEDNGEGEDNGENGEGGENGEETPVVVVQENGDDVAIDGVDAGTALTIANISDGNGNAILVEFDGGDDLDASLALSNISNTDVATNADGSGSYALMLDDVDGGAVALGGGEEIAVTVMSDSELDALAGDDTTTTSFALTGGLSLDLLELADEEGDLGVDVTGGGDLTLGALGGGTGDLVVDASAATGDIDLQSILNGFGSVDVTLGSGADTVSFEAGTDLTTVTADGGAGSDEFVISAEDALGAGGEGEDEDTPTLSATNFERLGLNTALNDDFDLDEAFEDFDAITLEQGTDGEVTVSGLESGNEVRLEGVSNVNLDIDDAGDSDDDSIDVVLSAPVGVDIGTIDADDVETVNIETDDADFDADDEDTQDAVHTATLGIGEASELAITGNGGLIVDGASDLEGLETVTSEAGLGLTIDLGGVDDDDEDDDEGVSVTTGDADDDITGSDEDDTISVGGGDDMVDGGDGDDEIDGGAGSDIIEGGAGDDTLTGGTNRDAFVFDEGDADDTDSITDFEAGETGDVIDLSEFGEGEFFGTASGFIGVNTALQEGTVGVVFQSDENQLVIDVNASGDVDGADFTIDVSGFTGEFVDENFRFQGEDLDLEGGSDGDDDMDMGDGDDMAGDDMDMDMDNGGEDTDGDDDMDMGDGMDGDMDMENGMGGDDGMMV